jgi:type IV pilus assembly protein PilE
MDRISDEEGFTLIELMIVVLIISILAAVGYPAYQSQVEKGHLSEGRAALTQFASQLERCYTRFGDYGSSKCDAYSAADNDNYFSENDTYKIDVRILDGGNSFVAVANRQKATSLNKCGNLTLEDTGQKGVSGGASKPADECW